MKIRVSYQGATSSGRMHKFAIVVPIMPEVEDGEGVVTMSSEAATAAELLRITTGLKAAGVVLNTNIGDRHFLSSTHLYSAPTIGNEVDVDVRGYHDTNSDRDVNFFADIDKAAQKDFAQRQVVNRLVGEVVMVETALSAKGSSIDAEKFERIQLLKTQQRKLEKEMQAIIVGE